MPVFIGLGDVCIFDMKMVRYIRDSNNFLYMSKETKTKNETVQAGAGANAKKKSRALSLRPSVALVAEKVSSKATAADAGKGKTGGKAKVTKAKVVSQAKKNVAGGKKAGIKAAPDADIKAEKETKAEEEEVFARWKGKNFISREWEKPFYQVCLIASAVVILGSLGDGSWLRAVTFFALAVILVFELRDKPMDIDYEINIDGIQIDGKLYKFEDIRSFALGKKAGFDIVKLEIKSSLFPVKELHLAEGQDVLYIETLLEYFLPKETQEDSLFNFHKEEKSEELSDEEFINKKVDEYLKGRF